MAEDSSLNDSGKDLELAFGLTKYKVLFDYLTDPTDDPRVVEILKKTSF